MLFFKAEEATFSLLERVSGLLVIPFIYFFIICGDSLSPKGVTIFGIEVRIPLALVGSDEASFWLGVGGFFVGKGVCGLGRGSEVEWRLNDGGRLGSGDGGAS
jgi:hypothetical protein